MIMRIERHQVQPHRAPLDSSEVRVKAIVHFGMGNRLGGISQLKVISGVRLYNTTPSRSGLAIISVGLGDKLKFSFVKDTLSAQTLATYFKSDFVVQLPFMIPSAVTAMLGIPGRMIYPGRYRVNEASDSVLSVNF